MAQLKDLWDSWDKTKLPMRVVVDGCIHKYTDIYFESKHSSKEGILCGLKDNGFRDFYFPDVHAELYKEPKKAKELWQWIYCSYNGWYWSSCDWMTEAEAEAEAKADGGKVLVGKDPNCLKPLIVEVDE